MFNISKEVNTNHIWIIKITGRTKLLDHLIRYTPRHSFSLLVAQGH